MEVDTMPPVEATLTEECVSSKQLLYAMGKHPLSLKHAFLGMNASNLGLFNVNILENYSSICYLDISMNAINSDSLLVLKKLPTLIQLNASGNNIDEVVDFSPPLCNEGNMWSTGQKAFGSVLTLLDLSNNKITSMVSESESNFKPHKFLECLLLKHNHITRISGISDLKYLKVLDLSNNMMKSIKSLDGLNIEELKLSCNLITTLKGLENLFRLTTLCVDGNQINCLAPLKNCLQLKKIDVCNNSIDNTRQTEYLSKLPLLVCLFMTGNPCCSKKYYRYRVINKLPLLKQLDLTLVSSDEKVCAMNIYQGGDLSLRRETLERFIPGEIFIVYKDFEEDETDPEEPSNIPLGSRIEGNYRGNGKWYPGKISRDRGDGTYDILYNDGESELRVEGVMIRSTAPADADRPSTSNGATRFEEGSKVEGNYKGNGKWYPGKISQDRGDGTFDILYNDGESELRVESEFIRAAILALPQSEANIVFSIGDKVECNYKSSGRLYRGAIDRVCEDGTYDILYDDGDREQGVESSRISLIIVERATPEIAALTALTEGQTIEGNYRGIGKWYPGKISRDRGDGTFDILYDDGESELRVESEFIRVNV